MLYPNATRYPRNDSHPFLHLSHAHQRDAFHYRSIQAIRPEQVLRALQAYRWLSYYLTRTITQETTGTSLGHCLPQQLFFWPPLEPHAFGVGFGFRFGEQSSASTKLLFISVFISFIHFLAHLLTQRASISMGTNGVENSLVTALRSQV